MFKGIKENEYIQKFLQLWAVPRYRSFIILCLYIIFFAIVITSINTNSNSNSKPINTNKVDIMQNYKEMNSYQYNVTIKNEIKKELSAKVNGNKQLITFNNENYYYNNINFYKQEENVYVLENNELLEFEIWRFTPLFITNLIEKGKFESKTEYADGLIANTYLVNVADFVKLYFGDESQANDNISVTIYENDEMVTKVELDLTSVYHQRELANSYDYIVTLEYSLIGQIDSIIANVESSE